jgi:hypothetical protein
MYILPHRTTVRAVLVGYAPSELDFPGAKIDQANLRHVRPDGVKQCGAVREYDPA